MAGPQGPPGVGIERPGFAITRLDTVGEHTSVTIGSDGLGLISYSSFASYDLKVAHCSDVACTAATITLLDAASFVSRYTSVTIGSDGLGLISYFDGFPNNALKVAHCSDASCTTATITLLDTVGPAGETSAVVIGSDGLGLISYYDGTNGDLKLAHCANVACTAATITTLDSFGAVGGYSSMAIGSDGLGLITYYDETNGDLKVAHCSDVTCAAATTTTLDSAGTVGFANSVTIGSDGLGLISYSDGDLKVAHCSNVLCLPFHRSR